SAWECLLRRSASTTTLATRGTRADDAERRGRHSHAERRNEKTANAYGIDTLAFYKSPLMPPGREARNRQPSPAFPSPGESTLRRQSRITSQPFVEALEPRTLLSAGGRRTAAPSIFPEYPLLDRLAEWVPAPTKKHPDAGSFVPLTTAGSVGDNNGT